MQRACCSCARVTGEGAVGLYLWADRPRSALCEEVYCLWQKMSKIRWLTWSVTPQMDFQPTSNICDTCHNFCQYLQQLVALSSNDRPPFWAAVWNCCPLCYRRAGRALFVLPAKDEVMLWKDQGEKMFSIVPLRCNKNLHAPMKQPVLWYHNNGLLGLHPGLGWWFLF